MIGFLKMDAKMSCTSAETGVTTGAVVTGTAAVTVLVVATDVVGTVLVAAVGVTTLVTTGCVGATALAAGGEVDIGAVPAAGSTCGDGTVAEEELGGVGVDFRGVFFLAMMPVQPG
jgi:hypothetical protein